MNDNVELSVAINYLDRKIAELNIKMTKEPTPEVKEELEKYLTIKKEIYKGNTLLIKELINNIDK